MNVLTFIVCMVLFGLYMYLSAKADNERLRYSDDRDYEAKKSAIKRICARCKREYYKPCNSSLRVKFPSLDDYIRSEIDNKFYWERFIDE